MRQQEAARPADAVADGWALVTRVQGGDMSAFAELYRAYRPDVIRYLNGRRMDHATVEDLASDCFVRALRAMPTVVYHGRDVRYWLLTIARNLANDHVKCGRIRRETPVDVLPDVACAVDTERRALSALALDEVGRRVRVLPADQRQCLQLRTVLGHSVAETAVHMNRTQGAVKALLHRAMVRLREGEAA